MLSSIRKAVAAIVVAFFAFCIAYLGLMRITDPRPPFTAMAQSHPLLGIFFAIITYGAEITVAIVVIGSIIALGAAVREALKEKRHDLLQLFIVAGAILVMCALAMIFFALSGLLYGQAFIGSLFIFGWLFALIVSAVLMCLGILKSNMSTKLLRFASLPLLLATLSMSITFVSTLLWSIGIWLGTPQFAMSEGLYTAGPGGGGGLVLAMVMTALAIGCVIYARTISVRFASSAEASPETLTLSPMRSQH